MKRESCLQLMIGGKFKDYLSSPDVGGFLWRNDHPICRISEPVIDWKSVTPVLDKGLERKSNLGRQAHCSPLTK